MFIFTCILRLLSRVFSRSLSYGNATCRYHLHVTFGDSCIVDELISKLKDKFADESHTNTNIWVQPRLNR